MQTQPDWLEGVAGLGNDLYANATAVVGDRFGLQLVSFSAGILSTHQSADQLFNRSDSSMDWAHFAGVGGSGAGAFSTGSRIFGNSGPLTRAGGAVGVATVIGQGVSSVMINFSEPYYQSRANQQERDRFNVKAHMLRKDALLYQNTYYRELEAFEDNCCGEPELDLVTGANQVYEAGIYRGY